MISADLSVHTNVLWDYISTIFGVALKMEAAFFSTRLQMSQSRISHSSQVGKDVTGLD